MPASATSAPRCSMACAHRLRQALLHLALRQIRVAARQRAVAGEGQRHLRLQRRCIAPGAGRTRGPARSSRRRRIELSSSRDDLVAQQQAALLQAPQRPVRRAARIQRNAVDQVVQIGMFDAQFDQVALRRVQVVDPLLQTVWVSWCRSLYSHAHECIRAGVPGIRSAPPPAAQRRPRLPARPGRSHCHTPRRQAARWPCSPTAWAARAAAARRPTR